MILSLKGLGCQAAAARRRGRWGVDYGDELTAQSSTCYRSCPDGPTTQICPVGSLKNNALETATVLSNKGCPTGIQIRASAGAGCRRSQSTNQHNRPKEFTKPLRVNARWKVLSFSLEALCRGSTCIMPTSDPVQMHFNFFYSSHICTGLTEGI